jgi:casein kinase II subunit alpha
MEKYNLDLDEEYEDRLVTYTRKRWVNFINSENQQLVSDEALDFLDKCLLYDHVSYK